MVVYRVLKTGFDSMENRDPVYYETLGIYKTKIKAEKAVKEDKTKNPEYKGYDGETYPKYKTTKIKVE